MEYPISITVWTWMRAHELVPGTPVGGGAGARVTGSSNRERGIGLDSDDIYSPIYVTLLQDNQIDWLPWRGSYLLEME